MYDWSNVLQGGAKAYESFTPEPEYKRGVLDRLLGTIQNTSLTNALYNATDNNPDTGFIEGLMQGVGAMNPFADDVRDGTHTTSDVLSNLGWNPESLPGKFAKGTVSLAGDIVSDPLTYINPFSAVGKVISGTGKVVHGGKATMFSMEQAENVIKKFYAQKGINFAEINPDMYRAEVEDLYNNFNSKVMKIKSGGQDFQIGMKNLPFTDKIKVGDKTLDSFTKTFMSADSLRKVGDKTIAPYYQELANKIRSTKAYSALNKSADLMKKAQSDPEEAALIYKLDKMHKGFDASHINKDINSMSAANKAYDMWSELTKEEQSKFVKRYEEGYYKDWINGKHAVAEAFDKVRGGNEAVKKVDAFEKEINDKIKRMNEEFKIDKGRYLTALKKGRYDGAINEFMSKFDESKGLMTPEDGVIDRQIAERTVDDKMENVLKRYGYIPTADELAKPKKGYDVESGDVLDPVASAKYDIAHGLSIDNTPFIDEHMDKFKRGGELRNELVKMMKGELSPEARKEVEGTALFTPESKKVLTDEINSKLFGGEEIVSPDMSDKVFHKMHEAIKTKDAGAFRDAISDIYAVRNKDINDRSLWAKAKLDTQNYLTPEWFNYRNGDGFTKVSKIEIPSNKAFYNDAKDVRHYVELKEIPKIAQDYVRYKEIGGLGAVNQHIRDIQDEFNWIKTVAESYPQNYFSKRLRLLKFQIERIEKLRSIPEKKKMLDEVRKGLGLNDINELANVNPKMLDDYAEMINRSRLNLYNDIHGTKFGNADEVWTGNETHINRPAPYYSQDRENWIDDLQGELKVPDIRERALQNADINMPSSERGFQRIKSFDKKDGIYNYDYFERPVGEFDSPSSGYAGQLTNGEMAVNATDSVKGKWYNTRVNAFEPKTKAELLAFYQRQYPDQIGIDAKILRGMAKRDIVHQNTLDAWKKLTDEERKNVKRHFAFYKETAKRKELDAMPIEKVRQMLDKETDGTMAKYYQMYIDRIDPSEASLQRRLASRMNHKASESAQNIMKNNEVDEDSLTEIPEAFSKESPETVESVDEITDVLHSDAPSERELKLAKYISEHMSEIAENEYAKGRLSIEQITKMRGKYLAHIQTDEAKQWVLKNITKDFEDSGGFNPKTFAVGYEKRFNDGRKFKTIEEANEAMKAKTGVDKWFEDDVIKILQARSLASNRLVYNDEMTEAVRMIAGKPYEAGKTIEGHTPVCTFVDLNNKLRKVYDGEIPDEVLDYLDIDKRFFTPNNAYIPLDDEQIDKIRKITAYGTDQHIYPVNFFNLEDEMMNRLNRESAIQKRMHQSEFINFYDKWLSIWKMWNTTVTPGFHIQNTISNAFQSFMSDGKAVLEPKRIKQADDIFKKINPNQKIKIGEYNLTSEQYRLLAEKYGILDNTFFNKDIRFGMKDGGDLSKFGVKGKYDPTNINEFTPYRVGAEVGSHIEGTQRLVLFLKGLEDGKTIEESVENVNKFLFDYSDLTDFEKNVMKRVMPFYTFMRKNVPLQLEQIFTQPFLYATTDRVMNNIEDMSGSDKVDDANRTEWRRDFVQMPFKADGNNFGINPQLPQQQMDRISPMKILGQTTPLIKTPIEALTGEYVYTGIPIKSPLEYLLNQTQYTKMGNIGGTKEGSEKDLYILGQLTGLPMGTL